MTRSMKNRILRALSRTGFSARVLVAVALAGVITSACDVHGIVAPGTLASITVTPNATLVTGTTQQMVAVGYDAEGRAISISPTWSVAASGGTINATGTFTAGNLPGFFANTVVATVGGISARASITVIPGALATIVVTPSPVTLGVTATQQFIAVGKDASGNIVPFTGTWSVVAGGGSVDGAGIFTAGGVIGTYSNTVQASSAGIKGFATVNVTAGPLATITVTPNPATLIVGAKQQFVATGKDVSGNTVQIAATWSVVALGGTTDQAGLFTAGAAPGTYTNTVKATSGTLSGTATVVVTAGSLATITVTPNPATMTINGTQQFTAAGSDIAGNPIVIAPVWDVVALGGTINATGLFTAGVVSGTFTKTVRATSGGLSGFATVIVTTGPLATITVTPNPVFMPTNSPQQFVAVGKDANGNVFVLSTPPLVWSVVNGGGVIDNTGLFTSGPAAGFFLNTIQATSGLISGNATVTVTAIIPPPPPPPPPLVDFGAAAPNGIMAGASVTCSGTGVINADISISPGSTISGFPPCTRSGSLHLGDATALSAQNALTAAYNTLFGQACPAANNFGTVDYASKTLPAGVYCSGSTINVTGILTLNGGGDPNANFVFQAGSALIGAANIVLIGGAQAKNVYWVVGSSATLNASAWQGNIVALTSIDLKVNSTLLGRALARNGSVSLDASHNVITLP